MDFEI